MAATAEVVDARRILLAKVGFDGHDRGIKVLASLFREAGHEVIYLGKYLTVDQVVEAALEEDVDVIGLSFLGGAHVPYCQEMIERMAERGMAEVTLMVGGVIPRKDFTVLRELRITGIFDSNTPSQEILQFLQTRVALRAT
ncbi:MAG: cobalamin-dependent protein [Alphaproteobacteria bacterium]|jgi:methylmalonyl-CoA mutase C-terminal domain/subunit|nr:methylmalonyl-CoA mutase [Rhodospirillaceae bacterium]MDP6404241.1 cobalamin-dependent protein [Alphaproteobacteria bacterium]|tara:strand:- start:624 stop:1046 length:423 start_codon:yes stop_codon:yes gene_type:complete